jgi:hypothetical protein
MWAPAIAYFDLPVLSAVAVLQKLMAMVRMQELAQSVLQLELAPVLKLMWAQALAKQKPLAAHSLPVFLWQQLRYQG